MDLDLINEADNNNLKNLKCPICFQVPSGKVFQCKYGHIICGACYPSISECLQCGTPFGKKAIKSRALEATLSEVKKVECPFRIEGCHADIPRNLIELHVESCSFNTVKFGPLIKICKLIGYTYCPFRINQGNTIEAIAHFEKEHDCIVRESHSSISEFINFTEMISNGDNGTKMWVPLILNLKPYKCAIMILTLFNGAEKSISWIPFYLPYPQTTSHPSQFQVRFCIAGGGGIGADKAPLKWSITPIDIQNADTYLPHSYPFRIPITPLIQKYIVEGSLFVQAKVVKDDAYAEEVTMTSYDNSIIFTPFDMVTLERSALEMPSAPPL